MIPALGWKVALEHQKQNSILSPDLVHYHAAAVPDSRPGSRPVRSLFIIYSQSESIKAPAPVSVFNRAQGHCKSRAAGAGLLAHRAFQWRAGFQLRGPVSSLETAALVPVAHRWPTGLGEGPLPWKDSGMRLKPPMTSYCSNHSAYKPGSSLSSVTRKYPLPSPYIGFSSSCTQHVSNIEHIDSPCSN